MSSLMREKVTTVFDSGFATLFKAVSRIRTQLERADAEFRMVLAEELGCLRNLGDQYIDHWISLDEQIEELFEMYELPRTVSAFTGAHNGSTSTWGQTDVFVPNSTDAFPKSIFPTLDKRNSIALSFEPEQNLADATLTVPNEEDEEDNEQTFMHNEWDFINFPMQEATVQTFRQGMAYYDLLMFEQASRMLQAAVDEADNPIGRLYLAAAHAARERFKEALDNVHKARAMASHRVVQCATYEVEAQVHLAKQNSSKAEACLRFIAQTMPDYRDVWYNLGICLAHQQKWSEAESALKRVMKEDPEDIMAMVALIRVQLQQGKVSEAAALSDMGLQTHPRHVQLRHAVSSVLERQSKYGEAARIERALVGEDPTNELAWSRLSWLLVKLGRIDDAVAVVKKHLSLCHHSGKSLLRLGVLYLLLGDLTRAEATLSRVVVESSDKPLVWIALGRLSAKRGDLGKAYARFLRAIRDDRIPVRRLALYYYGVSLFDQGQLEESEKYLKAAAHLGDPNAAIYIALANVCDRCGRPLEATKLRSKAKRLLAEASV